jgi:hypothetical protein
MYSYLAYSPQDAEDLLERCRSIGYPYKGLDCCIYPYDPNAITCCLEIWDSNYYDHAADSESDYDGIYDYVAESGPDYFDSYDLCCRL